MSENAVIAGKTIGDIQFRKAYGLNILAIKRGDETIYNLDPQTIVRAHDMLFLMGAAQKISCAGGLFRENAEPTCENPIETFSNK